MNIAALVAANTSPTQSIDPAKIKARFLESKSWPRKPDPCQLWSIFRRAFWRSRKLCRRGRRRGRCFSSPSSPSPCKTLVVLTKHSIFWSLVEVQARISEIHEALQETKAVQEMKVHPSSFISCKQTPTMKCVESCWPLGPDSELEYNYKS